jgi:hypothetical protein
MNNHRSRLPPAIAFTLVTLAVFAITGNRFLVVFEPPGHEGDNFSAMSIYFCAF